MRKKDTPLIVLREIQNLLGLIREIISEKNPPVRLLENHEGALIYIEDLDNESNFYFKVLSATSKEVKISSSSTTNKIYFDYERCPTDSTSVKKWNGTNESQEVIRWIKEWADFLNEYNEIHLFQDEFVEKYTSKFYSDFVIIDKEADIEPFSLEQQLFLNEYLDIIEKVLEENDEEFNTQEIRNDVKELKQNLTQLSKNSVLKKLSIIWAKTQKKGLKLLKEIYTSFKKEVIKRVTTEGIDNIEQIGETVKQLLIG